MCWYRFLGVCILVISACDTHTNARRSHFGDSNLNLTNTIPTFSTTTTKPTDSLLEEIHKLNFPIINEQLMPGDDVLKQAKGFHGRDARVLRYELKDGTEVVLKKARDGSSLNMEARNLYHLQSTDAVPRLLGVKKDENGNIIEIHMERGVMDLLRMIKRKIPLDAAEVEKFVDKFPLIQGVLDQLEFKYKDMRPDNLIQMRDGSIKVIDFEEMERNITQPGAFAQLVAKSLVQALLKTELSLGPRGATDDYIKYAFYLKYKDKKPEISLEKLRTMGDIYKFITRAEMLNDMATVNNEGCADKIRANLLPQDLNEHIDYQYAIEHPGIYSDSYFMGCFQDFVITPDYKSLPKAERIKIEDGIFKAALDAAPNDEIGLGLKDKLRKLYQL